MPIKVHVHVQLRAFLQGPQSLEGCVPGLDGMSVVLLQLLFVRVPSGVRVPHLVKCGATENVLVLPQANQLAQLGPFGV
jgi:hypothetical protein